MAPQHYSPDQALADIPEQWVVETELRGQEQDLFSLLPNADLELLVVQLLADNPALQRRMFELAELQALEGQAGAARLPQLTLSPDLERSGGPDAKASNQYRARLDASWELDIWGRLKNQRQAAQLDVQALELEIEYAKRSLLADFIHRYLMLLNGYRQLDLEQRRLLAAETNEKVINRRYRSGLSSLQDLNAAQADKFRQLAAISQLSETQEGHLRELQRLFGDVGFSDQRFFAESSINSWPQIRFPEVAMPALALSQRPDLLAAFKKIKAADQRSDYSYKQLLPSFTLTANLLSSSTRAGDVLSQDPSWTLLGQLTQTVFSGGRIKADIAAAEARAGQAYWSYRELLLAAFLEVAASLSQESSLADQQQSLELSLRHAQKSQFEYEQRYQRGLATILDVIAAQRTSFDVESQLLGVERERASNRISMALALGLPMVAEEG
ncbi:TolC family protein [Pseudoteredinibacter isoporae]|uniref:Outer membrane protein TolC n=1 Tax=Pseudoteredinibacter isoporae TaxID=570281 RepID=A0A7X0JV15_9GAMM|nr:TolC family protein [Pseudoteredinibacter isoporae]MBB6522667.1 outer membrane protein TolC [Pseudoteredinibacter isoporae]NHO88198.1 TolC family protein [Pseudoteredinibacter isoporae]NIB23471.1 TolC family protein [Pseudoteredinibacter isoporae]